MTMIYGPLCCTNRESITGYGLENSRVLLLGIAPGRQEMQLKRPGVGPSGKLLDAVLSACGYSREECYMANLCCFWKDEPNPDEIDACSERLAAEIRLVKPKLIVALGALATERMTGRTIGKARGAIVKPEYVLKSAWAYDLAQELKFTVLPTWHPAAILRVPSMGNDLVRDFLKIPRFLRGELETPVVHEHFVEDPRHAQIVWDDFGRRNPPQLVAVDVETENDLEDPYAKVISLAAAMKRNGVTHVWVFTKTALDGITEWYADSVRWLFHNGQYDTQAIYNTFGVWLPIVEDSMEMSYNTDERPGYDEGKDDRRGGAHGPGFHGLKQLSREYLSAGWYETETKGTLGKSLDEVAAPKLILVPNDGLEIALTNQLVEWVENDSKKTPSSDDSISKFSSNTLDQELVGTSTLDLGDPALLEIRKPKKASKKKAGPLMRFETPDEAKARFEAWLQNFYHYNGLDAAYTLELPDRLPKDRDEKNYRDILIPGANAYKEIQYQGICVDRARLDSLIEEFEPRLELMRQDLQAQAHTLGYRNQPKLVRDRKAQAEYELEHGVGTWPGYEPINLGSNVQMGEFLFKTLRLRPKMFTKKTGKPSIAADHLLMLDHPFCTAMKEHNQWSHVFGAYFLGSRQHIKADGKFHPYPWLHGTTTGRRAYTEPAMQTFPKTYTVGPELAKIREIIIPSPGMVLIEADYEQIEVWIGAILSGDQNMLADLQEPYLSTTGDTKPNYHSRVARDILQCTYDDDDPRFDAVRQTAKTTTFSLMYLVEEDHFGSIISRPKNEAGRILRRWYNRYSTFEAWQKKILREMRTVGEITTPFGYRRRFPIVLDHKMDKVAVNHPIQSVGGTFSLLSLIKLHELLKPLGARVLLDVHDSLLFECPRERVPEACALIEEVMCDPKIEGWPRLKIEIKIGDSWGETSMMKKKEWFASQELAIA